MWIVHNSDDNVEVQIFSRHLEDMTTKVNVCGDDE